MENKIFNSNDVSCKHFGFPEPIKETDDITNKSTEIEFSQKNVYYNVCSTK